MTSAAASAAAAAGRESAGEPVAGILAKLRRDGHLYANLDPLSRVKAAGTAQIQASDEDVAAPDWATRLPDMAQFRPAEGSVPGRADGDGPTRAADDLLARLVDSYCGTMAIEAEHLRNAEQRAWLYERIESGDHAPAEDPGLQRARLAMLVFVDGFERYLQQHFVGEKTLSVEGLDATVLVAEELVQLAAAARIGRVTIGMAHRGRLSVLTNVCGLAPETVMRHLEIARGAVPADPRGMTDDVLQHIGHESTRDVGGWTVAMSLLPNPSHLEFVNPVALGSARAAADKGMPALPVLFHGDAGFTGQGIVAETLNLGGLDSFSSGGAVHVIQDNALGFTTEPHDGRSTAWPSDSARGYDIPILHVNADDIVACLHATRIAFGFRQRFGRDVVLHVLGYRRLGHTEADEPRFTQARLYRSIDDHPRAVDQFAASLLAAGLVADGYLAAEREQVAQVLARCHAAARQARPADFRPAPVATIDAAVPTGVDPARLRKLARQISTLPEGFQPHPKVARVLERRFADVEKRGVVDWPHAELLALGTCVEQGVAVRLSGQDVVRGTFSQRHASLRDVRTDDWHSLFSATAGLRQPAVMNSPLSEASVLAFEYGYSLGGDNGLAIWEAQFGDFANGAQVIIDQFVSSGSAKWGRTSRLAILLPHGYEGAGPEHSSARVERYLQLAAEDNLAILAPTTAAQFFHALRWQALRPLPCPMVVFTPKSLLRARAIASALEDFAPGTTFRQVLSSTNERAAARRIVFATGKFAVELSEAARSIDHVLVYRVEQLAPWPRAELSAILASHPDAEVVWAQEEPANMGALHFAERELRAAAPHRLLPSVARPERAAVAEGYLAVHMAAQKRLVREALGMEE